MSTLLVSLPASVGPLSEWLTSLAGTAPHLTTVTNHPFPNFKIGTLDSLIVQIESLARLDQQFHHFIAKVTDIQTQMGVPIAPPTLATFKWDQSNFRPDRPINDTIQALESQSTQLDNDLKAQFQAYTSIKSNLLSIQKKQDGDLSIRSLHSVVTKDDFVVGSEHLTTTLVAVPLAQKSTFLNSYETLTDFVVPRSAHEIASDSEYVLYGVTLFKKFQAKFIAKARENKWTPREFEYSDDIIQSLRTEFDDVRALEATTRNDLLRLVSVSAGELYSNWFHVKILKAFVESVLRYGLPPNFSCFSVSVANDSSNKGLDKIRTALLNRFKYLQGKDANAAADSRLNDYANLVDTNYTPFVIYTID